MNTHRLRLGLALAALLAISCSDPTKDPDAPGGPGGPGGPKDPPTPVTCDAGCPSGYQCQKGVCTGGSPTGLAFDLKTVTVSGRLTIDGVAPVSPEPRTCSGEHMRLLFESGPPKEGFLAPRFGNAVSADIACTASDGTFSARLTPGTYRVTAYRTTANSTFPDGTFVVNKSFQVTGTASGLRFDLQTVSVSGALTVDGVAPVSREPRTCSGEHMRLLFLNEDGASGPANIDCAATDGAFSARLAPGAYRVTAYRTTANSTFPDGTFVVNKSFQVTGAASGLRFDLQTVSVSGALTVDGVAPVSREPRTCSGEHMRLLFLNEDGASGPANIDCAATDGAFSARLAPGTYRVTAYRTTANSTFPDGTFVVNKSFQVTGAASGLRFDLQTIPIAGKLTVDGRAPVSPEPRTCSGEHMRLLFLNEDGASGSANIDCAATDAAFSARLAPGTYRVTAYRTTANSTFPDGTFVVNKSFQVAGAASGVRFDLQTIPIAGKLTVDGRAPVSPEPRTCSGEHMRLLFLNRDGASGGADIACAATDGSFSGRLGAGTYLVTAYRTTANSTFPDGTFVLVDNLAIP